jgi:hypothetical protein
MIPAARASTFDGMCIAVERTFEKDAGDAKGRRRVRRVGQRPIDQEFANHVTV